MANQQIRLTQEGLRSKIISEMTRVSNKSMRLLQALSEAHASLPREVSDQIAMEVFGMPFADFYKQTGFFVGPADYAKIQQYFKRVKEEEAKRSVVESMVRKALKEDLDAIAAEEEEYNPYLNGDASWIAGSYDLPCGLQVDIDTRLSTVDIKDPNNPDGGYFLQGDEGDELITAIARYWADNDCSEEEAVNFIVTHQF